MVSPPVHFIVYKGEVRPSTVDEPCEHADDECVGQELDKHAAPPHRLGRRGGWGGHRVEMQRYDGDAAQALGVVQVLRLQPGVIVELPLLTADC